MFHPLPTHALLLLVDPIRNAVLLEIKRLVPVYQITSAEYQTVDQNVQLTQNVRVTQLVLMSAVKIHVKAHVV